MIPSHIKESYYQLLVLEGGLSPFGGFLKKTEEATRLLEAHTHRNKHLGDVEGGTLKTSQKRLHHCTNLNMADLSWLEKLILDGRPPTYTKGLQTELGMILLVQIKLGLGKNCLRNP